MVSFIFGGNTGIKSPQELAERRALVRSLMARDSAKQPKNLWEGLSFLSGAIGSRFAENKLDKTEAEGKAGATSKFQALISALGNAGAEPGSAGTGTPKITPAAYSPTEQTGLPSGTETGAWLAKRLQSDPDLKLTPAAAAGFAGNFDVETGGFKHMQEIKPVVPGSRGGFGFAQWTGPRRKAFESWAAEKGLDPTTKEANLGFLKHELLNTPEGKVLPSLQGVEDPTTAAAIISSQYLRPGIPNIQNRVAAAQKYAGMGEGAGAPSVVQAPAQVAQAGNGLDPRLLEAMGDPWLAEGQQAVVKSMLERQFDLSDPRTKLQLEKLGIEIDALKNPKPKYGFTKLDDGSVVRTDETGGTVEPIYKGAPKKTDDIAEYEYYVERAKAAGQTPLPFEQFQQSMKKAGATSINMATGEPGDGELRKKLQGKEGELWSQYQATAAQSGAIVQQLDVLDELGKTAPQGPLTGRLAQMFPGFSSAGDAFTSIATRIAPSFRTPGSGSQSDIEYEGFLNSLPRLQTSPGGNSIISATLRSKAAIEVERGAVVDRYSNGEIGAAEARRQMAEINKRSIMTPELQAVINANAEVPAAGTPDADGWVTHPNGVKVREKK